MVLGLRSRHKKSASVLQLDFTILVEEIKPWPPSQSLRSVRSVLLVWQNGDQNSGSFLSNVGDSGIEFNESFTLPVTLSQEKKTRDKFQKNILILSLYEPRKDKASRGQLLGTATINLADFGAIEEDLSICTPLSTKKASKSLEQPSLFITIKPAHKHSSEASLSKSSSVDKDEKVSVADSVNEGVDEQCEIASFTDDDVSSHSSLGVASSSSEVGKTLPLRHEKDGVESTKKSFRRDLESPTESKTMMSSEATTSKDINEKQQTEQIEDIIPRQNSCVGSQEFEARKMGHPRNDKPKTEDDEYRSSRDDIHVSLQESQERKLGYAESEFVHSMHAGLGGEKDIKKKLEIEQEEDRIPADDLNVVVQEPKQRKMEMGEAESKGVNNLYTDLLGRKDIKKKLETVPKDDLNVRSDVVNNFHVGKLETQEDKKVGHGESETANSLSVRFGRGKDIKKLKIKQEDDRIGEGTEDKSKNSLPDQTNEWKLRIEMLEEELREAAAVEFSLYSIVPEHSSSSNKVHAPARRLSRFFFNALKAKSQTKQENCSRTAVSGLALVSKACGNDVPRLAFWLSNTIMLRTIIGEADETKIFSLALEQVEAWIFSRIVESIWWQIFTPHMQKTITKKSGSSSKKGNKLGFGDQEPGSFSIDLWKKAFNDACERLCPVRAEGHECGCLPMLSKLVMEQLVSRLDVAMFNAILRESADEMPTDPVSDPISNPKVLPIPVGKLSFSAGVQLKNAIGNWSRWLSDLFEIEEDSQRESQKPFPLLNTLGDLTMVPFEMLTDPEQRKEVCPSFGPALIKIILGLFVPDEFSPKPVPQDVFQALDSEDDMDAPAESFTSFPCTATPIAYSPPTAASVAQFTGESGTQSLARNGSSVLKKSYTSDDELDEVDSPLTSIIADRSRSTPTPTNINSILTGKSSRKLIRYQLLRELWREDE